MIGDVSIKFILDMWRTYKFSRRPEVIWMLTNFAIEIMCEESLNRIIVDGE